MLHDLIEKITDAETLQAYNRAVKELADSLRAAGEPDKAQKLTEIAALRNNRFSKREAKEDFAARKAAVVEYCRLLQTDTERTTADLIAQLLKNFHLFCRNLYKSDIHDKCSDGIKEHLTGFGIENEYDLQKLMLAAVSPVFPDARIESVQDTGHHAVRKDIVIDSESVVIELKCTRTGMTERQLSEEIASDMLHYDCSRLYFYIYDKAGIIRNPVSFKETYEHKNIDGKAVKIRWLPAKHQNQF